ncbi:MAG TPA: tripartite tricarboxylate transporter substrate binding protein [Burkholderiales bacterium]|nr:tripartite tricarboxylate transporter substrate binding protein [Burkholderiales bacterium]
MNRPTATRVFALIAALTAATLCAGVQAQQYPSRAVKIIAPFSPGGGSDFIARFAAKKLSDKLGQQVFVDNRPGAGGNIGAELAVKSPPDGYTLLLVAGSYTVNPSLYKLTFDPVNDITPIAELSQEPFILAINPQVKANNLREFVALVKSQPGKLAFASAGSGSITHLAAELFLETAGLKMIHVPYKGTAPAVTDTVSGSTQFIVGSVAATLPQVKAGRLRGLAVSTGKRIAAAADLPTVAEAGVSGYDITLWHGLVGPRGMARPIVEQLNRDLNTSMHSADAEKVLADDGILPSGGTPEQFAATIRSDIERWSKVVKQANIHVD